MFRLPPWVAGQRLRKRVIRNLLKEKKLGFFFFWLHLLILCLLFIFSCHTLHSFFSLIHLVHFHGNAWEEEICTYWTKDLMLGSCSKYPCVMVINTTFSVKLLGQGPKNAALFFLVVCLFVHKNCNINCINNAVNTHNDLKTFYTMFGM